MPGACDDEAERGRAEGEVLRRNEELEGCLPGLAEGETELRKSEELFLLTCQAETEDHLFRGGTPPLDGLYPSEAQNW